MRVRSPATLRTRVALLSASVMLVTLAFTLALVASLFSSGLRNGTDQLLHEDLESLRGLVIAGPNGGVELFSFAGEGAVPDEALRHIRYQVRDEGGTILLHSPALGATPLPWPDQQPVSTELGYDTRYRNEGVRVRVVRVDIAGTEPRSPVYLQSVRSIEPFLRQEERLRVLLLVLAPIPVVLAGIGSLGMAHVALRPLRHMIQRVTGMGPNNLHETIEIRATDEVGHLARAFNSLVTRLERTFGQLRQFTADASHELRGPLTALRARGEVVLGKPRDTASYRAAIADMLEETARLEHLTETLLQLARGDAGTVRLNLVRLDLTRVLHGWVEQALPLADQKQISLCCEAPDAVTLEADPVVLGRAIANLIANAIRFTPAAGTIQIRLLTGPDNIIVDVRDSGPGIPVADRERVFERFVQLDPARSRHAGFGLGLPIARWAVALHGGTIVIEPNEPRGCCVRLRLPRTTA